MSNPTTTDSLLRTLLEDQPTHTQVTIEIRDGMFRVHRGIHGAIGPDVYVALVRLVGQVTRP